MHQVQGRLVADLALAADLERTDPLLGPRSHPERVAPDREREARFLEHGTGTDRGHLLAAATAPPEVLVPVAVAVLHLIDVFALAAWTSRIAAPAVLFQELDRGDLVDGGDANLAHYCLFRVLFASCHWSSAWHKVEDNAISSIASQKAESYTWSGALHVPRMGRHL